MDILVSTEWLEAQLSTPDVRIVDATMFLPGAGRSGRDEYEQAHIPGTVFMDLDAIVDRDHPAPHMLPTAEQFAEAAGALGLSERDRIVVYDNSPLHSGARAWWMLRVFGARDVAVLDGGLQKWLAEGRPTESGATRSRPATFKASFDPSAVVSKQQLLGLIGTDDIEILDARSAGRFTGAEAEPRPEVAGGHIPGSNNLPQGQLFDDQNRYKRGQALAEAFAASGVDLDKPLVTSCGSGVTAAVLLLGAALLGKRDVQIYDGSWSEWGSDPETPKALGPG
jgi:thiosulfate/3-mercaptopyruvate sulfurtransferase